MAIGFVEARTLLEPGSSFCWGPALEVSTSPSSLFYMLGNMDDIDASTFFLGLRQAGQGGKKRRQGREFEKYIKSGARGCKHKCVEISSRSPSAADERRIPASHR